VCRGVALSSVPILSVALSFYLCSKTLIESIPFSRRTGCPLFMVRLEGRIHKYGQPAQLDEETRAAIREGRGQARRGEFAGDEEMAAFFDRHGVKPGGG
jgi:hypothetical protein